MAVYHGTFCINSLAHVHGSKRYVTGDDSRNNWLLAFFTMGEGWHNNHHAYQASVRQGFRWWEIDPTFYIIKALSWLGIVWDLKSPPEAVLRNEQKLGSRVIDRAAKDLVATFNVEAIRQAEPGAGDHAGSYRLRARIAAAQHRAHEVLAHVHLPHLPTREEIWARASSMFVKTRSLDDIVERAHRMILEAVGARLAPVSHRHHEGPRHAALATGCFSAEETRACTPARLTGRDRCPGSAWRLLAMRPSP